MKAGLPYPPIRAGGFFAVDALALLTAFPTLHFELFAKPMEAIFVKSDYLAVLGLEISVLQQAFVDGTLSAAALFRLIGYGFLHTGLSHLMFNLIQLLPLWWLTARRLGGTGMVAVYLSGVALSGLLHLISGPSGLVTIGASGGVHFLGGLWAIWAFQDRIGPWLRRIWPALLVMVVFAAENVFLIQQFGLNFAWDLHLWGFLAGMALASFIPSRRTADALPQEDGAST